jgi:uncharacterized protein (DUF488 family)
VLTRQKILLALLGNVRGTLSPTVFVKMVFLLRQETILRSDPTFYDFVPYKFGPFSFGLYRELSLLRHQGLVSPEEDRVALSRGNGVQPCKNPQALPSAALSAVSEILTSYGDVDQETLLTMVYSRYPWYTTRTERRGFQRPPVVRACDAPHVIYTAGYEGKSVDGFLNELLKVGIEAILDVRANPISRKYGFARKSLCEIATKLGITYHHLPKLGIPSAERQHLGTSASYESLLHRYERQMLPRQHDELNGLLALLRAKPSVLVCVEKDPLRCHRERLARVAGRLSAFPIVHL